MTNEEREFLASLAKSCNEVFIKYWETKSEELKKKGHISIELKSGLGRDESKKRNLENAVLTLNLFNNEKKKYTVTLDNFILNSIICFDFPILLSEKENLFEQYSDCAYVLAAHAEAIRMEMSSM